MATKPAATKEPSAADKALAEAQKAVSDMARNVNPANTMDIKILGMVGLAQILYLKEIRNQLVALNDLTLATARSR